MDYDSYTILPINLRKKGTFPYNCFFGELESAWDKRVSRLMEKKHFFMYAIYQAAKLIASSLVLLNVAMSKHDVIVKYVTTFTCRLCLAKAIRHPDLFGANFFDFGNCGDSPVLWFLPLTLICLVTSLISSGIWLRSASKLKESQRVTSSFFGTMRYMNFLVTSLLLVTANTIWRLYPIDGNCFVSATWHDFAIWEMSLIWGLIAAMLALNLTNHLLAYLIMIFCVLCIAINSIIVGFLVLVLAYDPSCLFFNLVMIGTAAFETFPFEYCLRNSSQKWSYLSSPDCKNYYDTEHYSDDDQESIASGTADEIYDDEKIKLPLSLGDLKACQPWSDGDDEDQERFSENTPLNEKSSPFGFNFSRGRFLRFR